MRPVLAGAAGRMLPAAAALAFVAALVCLAPPATATDRYWADGSGQWDVAENWDPVGQPEVSDSVYLTQSDATDRTVTYYNTTNPTAVLNSLRIDATGLGAMTLDMPNDHTLLVNFEYVGYDGKGAVTQSAGTHSAATLYLGGRGTGEGTYTITGGTLGSSYLYVGREGVGTLNIEAGGQVSSLSGYLGDRSGSTGTATVTGDGSTWTNSQFLFVGWYGSGIVNIEAGGQVSSVRGYLGSRSGTGTATVTGDGSKWTSSDSLQVGDGGNGTLNIEAGGQVSNTDGYLGFRPGTGTAMVTGAGSTWTNSATLYVGYDGTGTLTVADGGRVTARTLHASPSDLLGNGTITAQGAVLDADLVFDSTHGLTQALAFGTGGTLNLNVDGTGGLGAGYKATGTLRIADGLTVASTFGYLGHRSGSTGTATVTGDGSTWTNTGDLYVGWQGTGTLNIEAGGRVSDTFGYLGRVSGSTGTATVTGAGSVWTNSKDLYVGYGDTGTLTVADGGLVSAQTLYASPSDLYGNGTITAQGGVLDADLVFDSTHGPTQALAFGSGGTLNLNVDGTGGLGAGHKGTGTLRIADGRTVASASGYLGFLSGSTGTATVTGDGSKWTNSVYLYVGHWGAGALNIEAGGQVSSIYGYLGCSGSTSTATVTGNGSKWTNGQFLYVGYHGAGTLSIENGGQVSNTYGYLGCGSVFTGTATVTGAGSTWTNSSDLYVGYLYGGTGTLNIEAGGQVSNTGGYLGDGFGSIGTATVTGEGSTWTNSGDLYVGGSSSAAKGTGSVTVTDGGQLAVGGTLKLWTADSAVTVNGGTLSAGALAGLTGTVRITDPAGGTALTVGSAASGTFSAALRDDTGPGSLTKIGAGTQTLTGVGITYTGATTVLEGILKLSNTTAFASNILNAATTEFAVEFSTWTFNEALAGSGTFVKAGGGTLVVAGPQDYDPGALFDVLGGAMVLNTDASGTGLMADAHLLASVTGAELRFGCNQHLDTLTVGGGGKVVFAGANCGVMKHLANTGTMDMATGNLVVDYDGSSPLAAVRAMLASGYAGGTWDGPGIQSSTAAADPDDLTAVGVLDNTDPAVGGKTEFAGQAVDATSVLVKYTWWGDANLDGVVDANDYDVIDKMFLLPPVPDNMGWWTGDFNYDGVIDANDYDRIDRAFLFQTGPLAGGATAPTPEPATLALLALGAAALAGRRRAAKLAGHAACPPPAGHFSTL